MFKHLAAACLCLSGLVSNAAAADLTPLETRWLSAAYPVLDYARSLNLPIDIVVQPQAGPNDVPMAMGFAGGAASWCCRCAAIRMPRACWPASPAEAQGELIEAMAAHEIGHCWRYAQGAWHALPAGFVEVGRGDRGRSGAAGASKAMRETRREEGYADLVALAWTRAPPSGRLRRVYAWLEKVRQRPAGARATATTRASGWPGARRRPLRRRRSRSRTAPRCGARAC